MQRQLSKGKGSFTIVDAQDFDFDESISVKNAREIPSPTSDGSEKFHFARKPALELIDSDSEDESLKDIRNNADLSPKKEFKDFKRQARIPSAGPSGRQTVTKLRSPNEKLHGLTSESESEESDGVEVVKKNNPLPGEYDPLQYEDLEVADDVKDIFQYITKYIPQQLNLDFKFKPFLPDFIPAVGDIDAFLKIIPPEKSLSGELFIQSQLGLTVLDEPAANQSDPALLHLQLRATSVNVTPNDTMIVKKVDNVENNPKIIDKWIKDVQDLHKSKSAPVVKYSNPMPDLDDLMQEWPEQIENLLQSNGFPSYKLNCSLTQYTDIVCCLFDIPLYQNRIQSLHMLFCLFAAIKNSQLYGARNVEEAENKLNKADQLVLE